MFKIKNSNKMFDFEIAQIKQLNIENESLKKTCEDLRSENESLKDEINRLNGKSDIISRAIVEAVDKANQIEDTSKSALQLEIQRTRLLYLKLEKIYNELSKKYPEILKDDRFKDLSAEFKNSIIDTSNKTDFNEQGNKKFKKMLKSVKSGNVESAVLQIPKSSSGFDFNEALHPTDDLKDILKAFDLSDKKKKI